MSLEKIFEALKNLGLTKNDAKVYIYLATKGAKKSSDICNELNIKKQQLYPILNKMNKLQIITVTDNHSSFFSAIPFENALDKLINLKYNQSKKILQKKKKLVTKWKSTDWMNDI